MFFEFRESAGCRSLGVSGFLSSKGVAHQQTENRRERIEAMIHQCVTQESCSFLTLPQFDCVDLVQDNNQARDGLSDTGKVLDLDLCDRRVSRNNEQCGVGFGQDRICSSSLMAMRRTDAWSVDEHNTTFE